MWLTTEFNTLKHRTPRDTGHEVDTSRHGALLLEYGGGPVRTATHRPNGHWTTTLVDTVASSTASDLVDCAIAITANERVRVLYADGPDLKMGRYALESQTYWDGPLLAHTHHHGGR